MELRKNWKNKVEIRISIDLLKELLGIKGMYQSIGAFKRKVINAALKDINGQTDINVSESYKKEGKWVKYVIFNVEENLDGFPQAVKSLVEIGVKVNIALGLNHTVPTSGCRA